tara:strand:- start:460 stop:1371 length:912 start_codon:yes stop_codon:yes gene_type:complete
MIYRIYNYHTLIFFILALFSLSFKIETSLFTSLVCFFLILTVGISHGALDNIKGKKILKIYKIKNMILFYVTYILISLTILILWNLLPTATLLLFLIVASYHFGKEDSNCLKFKKSLLFNLIFLFRGFLIIFAPLYFSFNETINIFQILNFDQNILNFLDYNSKIVSVFFYLSLLSNIFFLVEELRYNYKHVLCDLISIVILNATLPPLIAFTVYFCFLHSLRHSISLIKMLNNKNFIKGTQIFVKKALPLTILTALLYLFAVGFLSSSNDLNDTILKVVFIGLASLTFPHILLEYLIEKNER